MTNETAKAIGHSLPNFTLNDFLGLVQSLQTSGYDFGTVSRMPHSIGDKIAYLRHDIDMHIAGIEQMANLESNLGVEATYYVPVSLHFNPLYPPNRLIL